MTEDNYKYYILNLLELAENFNTCGHDDLCIALKNIFNIGTKHLTDEDKAWLQDEIEARAL